MFCGKCGTQNDDNATFCVKCGASLKKEETKTVKPAALNMNDKNRKVGIIAIAAVVVVLCFVLLGGRSYKSTLKKYVNAYYGGDAQAIVDLFPDKAVKYITNYYSMSESDMADQIEYNNQVEYVAIKNLYLGGEDGKASYKITSEEKGTKDDIAYYQGLYDEMNVKVSGVKYVDLDTTVKSKSGSYEGSLYLTLVKVGKNWCIDIFTNY